MTKETEDTPKAFETIFFGPKCTPSWQRPVTLQDLVKLNEQEGKKATPFSAPIGERLQKCQNL